MTLAALAFANTICAYYEIDTIWMSYVGGTSILTLMFLYLASYVFKFCEYHRMFLHYIVICNIIDTIDIISNAFTQKAKNLKKTYNYKESLSLIDSSLYLCIREFNDSLQIINYSLKGEIYDSIKDFESAKKYYMQAAKLAYDTKFFDNCGKNMLSIGFLNKKSKNYETAIEIFKMICDSTEKFKMLEICQQSYYQISQCYALIGEYENAYLAFNKYDSYYDSTNMAYH